MGGGAAMSTDAAVSLRPGVGCCNWRDGGGSVMTHKYRGCIVVLSINKSVEPNEEQKVLMSSFDQGITVNTSKQVFRSILVIRVNKVRVNKRQ
jgi:hypothetical protein